MSEDFYTILTSIGKEKIINATALGNKINFIKLQVGDGNGQYYEPSEYQTTLKNVVWEGDISSVQIDNNNSSRIIIESIIPETVGGFNIREVGILDAENNLIAIGKFPQTYKSTLSEGSLKELRVRIVLEVSNVQNVNLKIDSSVILATKKDLESLRNDITNMLVYVTPRMLDNISDGIDISDIIQNAVEKFSVIFFPKGKYTISKQIIIEKPVILCGESGSIILNKTNGSCDNVFFFKGSQDNIINKPTVFNLEFDSDKTSRGSIKLLYCRNALISKCSFTGYSYKNGYYKTDSQILDWNCKNTNITYCDFYDNGYSNGTNSDYLNRCISLQESNIVNINKCTFDNVDQGIVSTAENLNITNCNFNNVQDNSLYLFKEANITDNVFKNPCDESIVICGDHYNISNNYISGTGNKCIAINGNIDTLVITINTFDYIEDTNCGLLISRQDNYLINNLKFDGNIINAENKNLNESPFIIKLCKIIIFNFNNNTIRMNSNIDNKYIIYAKNEIEKAFIKNNTISNIGGKVLYLIADEGILKVDKSGNSIKGLVLKFNTSYFADVDLIAFGSTDSNIVVHYGGFLLDYDAITLRMSLSTLAEIPRYTKFMESLGLFLKSENISEDLIFTDVTGIYQVKLSSTGYMMNITGFPSDISINFNCSLLINNISK